MSLALHDQNLLDEKNGYIGGRGNFLINYVAMVNSLQVGAHFFKICELTSNCLVQFLAKLWASTAKMKGVVVLQTFRQSQNESTFQHNSSIF